MNEISIINQKPNKSGRENTKNYMNHKFENNRFKLGTLIFYSLSGRKSLESFCIRQKNMYILLANTKKCKHRKMALINLFGTPIKNELNEQCLWKSGR